MPGAAFHDAKNGPFASAYNAVISTFSDDLSMTLSHGPLGPVSYTHLDVYKRQRMYEPKNQLAT